MSCVGNVALAARRASNAGRHAVSFRRHAARAGRHTPDWASMPCIRRTISLRSYHVRSESIRRLSDGGQRTGRNRRNHRDRNDAWPRLTQPGKCTRSGMHPCTVAGRAVQCFVIDCSPILVTTGAWPWRIQQSREICVHLNDSLHASRSVSLRHGLSGAFGWNRSWNTAA